MVSEQTRYKFALRKKNIGKYLFVAIVHVGYIFSIERWLHRKNNNSLLATYKLLRTKTLRSVQAIKLKYFLSRDRGLENFHI